MKPLLGAPLYGLWNPVTVKPTTVEVLASAVLVTVRIRVL